MNATTHSLNPYEHSDVHASMDQTERRQPSGPDAEPEDLLPARGVVLSVIIGLAMWGLIFLGGWLIFR